MKDALQAYFMKIPYSLTISTTRKKRLLLFCLTQNHATELSVKTDVKKLDNFSPTSPPAFTTYKDIALQGTVQVNLPNDQLSNP